MAMRFRPGDPGYAGRLVWEGEAAGCRVVCHIEGRVDGRGDGAERMSPDEVEAAGGWFSAGCDAVGAYGLVSVAFDEFGAYADAVAYLEDAVDRVGEGEFDGLLGKAGR